MFRVEIVGIKYFIAQVPDPEREKVKLFEFLPLFDKNLELIGSQLLFQMMNGEMRAFNLKNLKKSEYGYQNEYARFDYKIFNRDR